MLHIIMPRSHRAGALSDDARLTSVCLTSDVCLSRTSGLSREQRGLARLKLAQVHVTRTPLSRSKGQGSTCRGRSGAGHIVAAYRTACLERSARLPYTKPSNANVLGVRNVFSYFIRVVNTMDMQLRRSAVAFRGDG